MAGRPQECDRAEAARRAALQFWRTGLEGTSVDALVAETGMNRFGLYGELGGKKGLFLKACESYSEQSRRQLIEPLMAARDARLGLRRLFSTLIDTQLSRDPKVPHGCFMARTLSDEASSDPEIELTVKRHFEALELAFSESLARSAGLKSPNRSTRAGGLLLINTLFGLLQTARLHPSKPVLRRIADRAIQDAIELSKKRL